MINNFVSVWTKLHFSSSILYFWVGICFSVLRFYISFMCHFFIPVCSAELFTEPFLVAWLAHNLLTTLPALHQPFCFSLSTLSGSWIVSHTHTHAHSFFSLNMSESILFLSMFHVVHLLGRLSRAIQNNFSCLAIAQITDCYICLPSTHFVWVSTNHPI